MDEILYELREHSAGLNAGRWDYIFSVIKKFRRDPGFVLPDRARITMTVPFMRAYTELLVRTCHRRGAHAMGGMAAYIPSRRDPEANELALAKVAEDKEREANAGFDGTWVAHPDLVETAMAEFDRVLGDRPNQVDRQRDDVGVSAEELLDVRVPGGEITEAGLRTNVNVGLRYLASWLSGVGAAAIDNLMEDAATAEISRSQIWQWVEHGAELATGAAGHRGAGPGGDRVRDRLPPAAARRGGVRRATVRRGARAVRAGRARAGVRRVPDAPRLRAALTDGLRRTGRAGRRPSRARGPVAARATTLWVAIRQLPPSAAARPNASSTRRSDTASWCPVGSSASTRVGDSTSARATAVRCCSPSEVSFG